MTRKVMEKRKAGLRKMPSFTIILKIMDNMMKEYGKMHNKEYN